MKEKKKPDWWLLGVVILLILIGLLILASISVFFAEKKLTKPFFFFSHQLFYGLIPGIFFALIAYKIPLFLLKKWSYFLLFFNIILLAMIFLPNFGVEIGGAQRWLKIGNISFQPSEFLKVTFFLYLASFLTSNFREKKSKIFIKETKESWKKFISFLLILAVIAILLILQPDISTLGIIIFIALLMYFLGKAPIWHILVFLIIIGVLFSGLIKIAPYRIERILVFLNPEMDPLGAGYQIKQSLIAIGSGGVWGRGLGLSQQKLGFLPQSLSDSIFSIFAEETGFIGAIFLVFLFLFLFWRSLRIAKSAPDSFSQLLALGLGSHLIFQAFVNISALIGILPLTGIPLPFISYGGSALVTNLTEIGLLLNISKQAKI